jgi:hypothetical protein
MNTDNFLKLSHKDFFDGFVPLKPVTYCVVIVYDNGYKKEVYGIENPWKFINALKKNPRIKDAYIKSEK